MTSQPLRNLQSFRRALPYLLLALLLAVASWLRLVGLDWDEDQSLHPDERFLTMVETRIQPAAGIGEYFDTASSPLNPANRDFGFYVYGTLPIFLTRYLGEWMGRTGWGEINLVGRVLSALMDLGVIFLVFLLAERLYGRRAAVIAAAFSTFTVMQIQQSHFFTVDNFLNFFAFLAVVTAAFISTEPLHEEDADGEPRLRDFRIGPFLLFGAALGMAVASKVNAGVVCLMLPLAVVVRMARMTPEERLKTQWSAAAYTVAAALFSLVVFRIFQPYAFNGPSFFNFSFNPGWVDSLRSLLAQQTGDVDWPPSIQWARRPLWFSAQNMILWGMGTPMALMAFGGFFAAAWRSLRGEWPRHAVVLGWAALWFGIESLKFNPTMRYQLPSYPTFAVLAGYAVTALWDGARALAAPPKRRGAAMSAPRWRAALPVAAGLLGGLSLALTAVWAFAFVAIYQQPVTRVAATRWIYQNIPGPLTVSIQNASGGVNQPLSFPYDYSVTPASPYQMQFTARATGTIGEVRLQYALTPPEERALLVLIFDREDLFTPLYSAATVVEFPEGEGVRNAEHVLTPDVPVLLLPGRTYQIEIQLAPGQAAVELQNPQLRLLSGGGTFVLPMEGVSDTLYEGEPYIDTFQVEQEATVAELYASFVARPNDRPAEQTLRLTLSANPEHTRVLAAAEATLNMSAGRDADKVFVFDQPVGVTLNQTLYLKLENLTAGGAVTLLGTAIANETNWDDGLPLRADGYDGFGGIYQPELNLDLYATSSPEYRQYLLDTLDRADYIIISSSRQWGSTPRIPERFPLNIAYYRALVGCPDGMSIEGCYNVAQPGMFEERLGFELIQVFQSNPTLGPLEINDQPAEEAFTVYDHPKVFIFKKSPAYSTAAAAAVFDAVDLSRVRHVSPKQAGREPDPGEPRSLLLPADRLARQQAGGTWRALYDRAGLMNLWQPLSVLLWYLAIFAIGLLAYPIMRWAFPGLPDKGYPLARGFGMLLLAYFVWLGGSLGVGVTRGFILLVLLALAALGGGLAWLQRAELAAEWRDRRGYFLRLEALFLAAFLAMLLVRLGNPELWHPAKGGEKPMDFAYFNAILKSATFPPYDPWFAGGYINYYYWGFVFVGAPVKLLGIVPSLAYNLVLPTLAGLLALGVFSAAWNLYTASDGEGQRRFSPYWVGLAAVLGVVFLGNLGTVQMILTGLARVGALGLYDPAAPLWTQLAWAGRGLMETTFGGVGLPYGHGDWYWNPSRIIPSPNDTVPITEFPWFTLIYADLHAHLMALPVTALALGFALAAVLGKAWRGLGWGRPLAALLLGGIAIGALRPINTWDLPTYLALALVALFYAAARYAQPRFPFVEKYLPPAALRLGLAALAAAVLAGLAYAVLFKPFTDWYALGYSQVMAWQGDKTPLGAYLAHWGLFLFAIVAWMLWETREWLAATPLSALRKLEPYTGLFGLLALVAGLVLVLLHARGVRIHWLALPLALWAAALLLRPGQPDSKRLVLFLVGTGLFLTMLVEVIVLSGDIARMNTVFKFYLQVWVLFGVAAAAATGWTAEAVGGWLPGWRRAWQGGLAALAAGAALFTLMGTSGKILDRFTPGAPLTLDGMDYMPLATYSERETELHLDQDHAAILWLQENVDGSPVIVEAKLAGEYRWGSRIAIYTGLPTVLGWQWHQIQQRVAGPPGAVEARAAEIEQFYSGRDLGYAREFIAKYNVRYIIVGELERATYDLFGLLKFEEQDGVLWRSVFRAGSMTIYEVIPGAGG